MRPETKIEEQTERTVLITGVAGFIGSHLADRLLELDYQVIGVDDLSRGKIENVNPQVEFHQADIRDYGRIASLFAGVDYVFHLAALARVRPSVEDPIKYNSVNVDGTLNVLDLCVKNRAKLIYASSSSIFGDSPLPWTEETDKNPANPYALQKLIGEEYIDLFNKLYGLNSVVLRFFNVYGPRQILGGAYSTVIGIFLSQRAEGKPLTILGDGKQRRDFTHIRDVVEAIVKSMGKEGRFNLGRSKNLSVQEIADMISPDQVYLPPVAGELRETLCDNRRARRELNWNPQIDVTPEIMKEMADYENSF